MREWRNWQTRQIQVLVLARVWRFKSSLPQWVIRKRLGSTIRVFFYFLNHTVVQFAIRDEMHPI